jgi:hypothetical protein
MSLHCDESTSVRCLQANTLKLGVSVFHRPHRITGREFQIQVIRCGGFLISAIWKAVRSTAERSRLRPKPKASVIRRSFVPARKTTVK